MTKLYHKLDSSWIRQMPAIGFLLIGFISITQANAENPDRKEKHTMKIEIVIGEKILKAELDDNTAARDFAAMLPLQLNLKDYAQTEKVSDLPGKLGTAGCPDGYKASVGDITYYAPWGNLAIFTKNFSYAGGLVYLGKIVEGMDALKAPGTLSATIRNP